jgi:hypothetical protein
MQQQTTIGQANATRETNNLIASDKVEGTPVRRSDGEKVGTIERRDDREALRQGRLRRDELRRLHGPRRGLPHHPLGRPEILDGARRLRAQPDGGPAPRLAAPSPEGKDASFDRDWEEHVHRYYNATPYWGGDVKRM